MLETVNNIKKLRAQIAKIEKDFKGCPPKGLSFTIDICYGGNKEVDISRVGIGGSIYDDENTSKVLHDLVLTSLKNSLKFWESQAEMELKELSIILANKTN